MALRWRHTSWMVVGLIASASLNLFFIGFLATRIGARPGPHMPGPGGPPGIERIARDLEPESRRKLHDGLAALRKELRPNFLALRAARDDVARLIAQDPLDRPALEAAFAKLEQARVEVQAKMGARFLATVADLPASERARLALPGDPPPDDGDGPPPDAGDGPPPHDADRPPPP